MMREALLAVDEDDLPVHRHNPLDGDILVRWNQPCTRLMPSIRRAAVHTQLMRIEFPVEDDLVGGVTNPEVGGIGFGHDRDFHGWLEGLRRDGAVIASEQDFAGGQDPA